MLKTANLTGSVSRNAGGLFESVRRLVQSLAATPMEVRVFGTVDEFTKNDLAAWNPVQVSAYPPTWPEQFGYSPHYLKDLGAFSPDITHTHGIWLYSSVATNHYCRKKKSPYVISPHGMLDPWAVQNSRFKKAVAYFLYEGAHLKGASCIRALNTAESKSIRQLGLKNRIAVIPNGIDLPDPACDGRLPLAPFRELKEVDRRVLLYLGRIHPKKGLSALLRSWAAAFKEKPQAARGWVLAIAGWSQGGHEAELQRLAGSLGLSWQDPVANGSAVSKGAPRAEQPSVLFLGPQFDLAKAACYRECDAFILPSVSEGLPMVVLEAWAWTKPVLMTPECNLPEGFEQGAAMRIDHAPQTMTHALLELFTADSGSLRAMGAAGYRLVSDRFVWSSIASEMAALYRWILGGGSPPACVYES